MILGDPGRKLWKTIWVVLFLDHPVYIVPIHIFGFSRKFGKLSKSWLFQDTMESRIYRTRRFWSRILRINQNFSQKYLFTIYILSKIAIFRETEAKTNLTVNLVAQNKFKIDLFRVKRPQLSTYIKLRPTTPGSWPNPEC